MVNIAVIGSSGYTGIELIRILLNHPKIHIKYLIGLNNVGYELADIYPHINGYDLPKIIVLDEADFSQVEIVFCCLPHGTSHETINKLPENVIIIDLSADFRIENVKEYERWYNAPHLAESLQQVACYGLTEFKRAQIRDSRIIACPGCYATSILLPLLPLVEKNIIDITNIIIDSKSGVTGAGRANKTQMLFSEVNEKISAYSIPNHRHIGEIEQELSLFSGCNDDKINLIFSPHLVPASRGILSTIYVRTHKKEILYNDLIEIFQRRFKTEKFIKLVKKGYLPNSRDVLGTNQCHIAISETRKEGCFIIISVLDNLIKGSSGQAVQNMNIKLGIPENTALDFLPIYP